MAEIINFPGAEGLVEARRADLERELHKLGKVAPTPPSVREVLEDLKFGCTDFALTMAEQRLGAQRGYPNLSVIPDDELRDIQDWMVHAVVIEAFLQQLDTFDFAETAHG